MEASVTFSAGAQCMIEEALGRHRDHREQFLQGLCAALHGLQRVNVADVAPVLRDLEARKESHAGA
jgi:hypothetical protein